MFCGEEEAYSSVRQRGHWTSERREENEAMKPVVPFLPRKVPLFTQSLPLQPQHDQRPLGQEACPLYGLLMDLPSGHLSKCPCLWGRGSPVALLLVCSRTPAPSLTHEESSTSRAEEEDVPEFPSAFLSEGTGRFHYSPALRRCAQCLSLCCLVICRVTASPCCVF